MSNFYALPEAARVAVSVLTVVCVGLSAIALTLHRYLYKRSLAYWLSSAVIVMILCQSLLNAALIAQAQFNSSSGFILPGGYIVLRYAAFVALAILFVFACTGARPSIPGLAAAASFLTLPCVEAWANRFFLVALFAAITSLLAVTVCLCSKIRNELVTSISGLSFKQAMNSLGTAVLFYDRRGHIIMQNDKMRELMIKAEGRVSFNGRRFFEEVVAPHGEAGASSDSYLLRLPSGLWLVTASDIYLGKRAVTRVTASDVTEQDHAAAVLRERSAELERRREHLNALVEDIEEICRAEELL